MGDKEIKPSGATPVGGEGGQFSPGQVRKTGSDAKTQKAAEGVGLTPGLEKTVIGRRISISPGGGQPAAPSETVRRMTASVQADKKLEFTTLPSDTDTFKALLKEVRAGGDTKAQINLLKAINQRGDLDQKKEAVAFFANCVTENDPQELQNELKTNTKTLELLTKLEKENEKVLTRYKSMDIGDASHTTKDLDALEKISGLSFEGGKLKFIASNFDVSKLSSGQFNALLARVDEQGSQAVTFLKKSPGPISYSEKQKISQAITTSSNVMKVVAEKGNESQKKQTVVKMAQFTTKNKDDLQAFGKNTTATVKVTYQETNIENGYLALRGGVLALGKKVDEVPGRKESVTAATPKLERKGTRGRLLSRAASQLQVPTKTSFAQARKDAERKEYSPVQKFFQERARDEGVNPLELKKLEGGLYNPYALAFLRSTDSPLPDDITISSLPIAQGEKKGEIGYQAHLEMLKELATHTLLEEHSDYFMDFFSLSWDEFFDQSIQHSIGTSKNEEFCKVSCDVIHATMQLGLKKMGDEDGDQYKALKNTLSLKFPENSDFIEKLMPKLQAP